MQAGLGLIGGGVLSPTIGALKNIRNRFKSKAKHILISNYGNEAKRKSPELEFEAK